MQEKVLRKDEHELNENIPNLWYATKIVIRGENFILETAENLVL